MLETTEELKQEVRLLLDSFYNEVMQNSQNPLYMPDDVMLHQILINHPLKSHQELFRCIIDDAFYGNSEVQSIAENLKFEDNKPEYAKDDAYRKYERDISHIEKELLLEYKAKIKRDMDTATNADDKAVAVDRWERFNEKYPDVK